MSDQPKPNYNATPSKDAFLVINQIPSTQSMQIQNTNKEYPIQLRVDPVTDYWALSITILVSIITALISAGVTVKIVTKSNKNMQINQNDLQREVLQSQSNLQSSLLDEQSELQRNFLLSERDKELDVIKSRHRQDWINDLRQDIAFILSKSNYISHDLRSIIEIDYKQNPNNTSFTYSEFIKEHGKLRAASLRVQLYLNMAETSHQQLFYSLEILTKLLEDLINEFFKPDEIIDHDDKALKLKEKIVINELKIIQISQDIFKEEWEKIKAGL